MPLVQTPESLTVVCPIGPALVQVTVVPALISSVDGVNWKSLIVTPASVDLEAGIIAAEARATLRELLRKLRPDEQELLALRFAGGPEHRFPARFPR